MKKLSLLLAVALGAGLLTGCTTGTAKIFEALKDDPAEVHLVIDRNGLKLDRTNVGAITNRAALTEEQKSKLRQVLDGK